MQVNPKVTNIAINAKGGALTIISTTKMASKVEIQEDPALNAGTPQGLAGFYLDPLSPPPGAPVQSPAVAQVWLANSAGQQGQAYQPIIFGGADGRVHGGEGAYVGAQNTPLLQLTTNSATAGGILLVEWD